MKFTSLGGFKNEWTFVLTGQTISELSSCIDDAGSCQVGISNDVYDCISNIIDCKLLNAKLADSGNYIIDKIEEGIVTTHIVLRNRFKSMSRDADHVRIMRRFVPRPVLHAIKYGTLDSVSELRSVTTVFLKLDSYCPVSNADPTTLQPFFEMAQKTLSEAGGFLRQFLIDDKGCVLIAMWGVPSYTFKNNNARAISFSLAVHKGVVALNHRCSIGVTTGNVFCGNVGSLHRRDYVGIGTTVNLAARLMSKSKGTIFIDDETASSVTKILPDMPKSEGMTLKGYSGLQYAYVLNGTESFALSTTGSVSSTYVQAGVTKKVMALLNKVSFAHQDEKIYSTSSKLNSIRGQVMPAAPINASVGRCRICFEGRLDEGEYKRMYKSLPSPDVDDVSESMESVESAPVTANPTAQKGSHCMVIEAQSGGGKSAVALLFASYSSKCAMQSYVVKLKTEDQLIDHCVLRKLFFKFVRVNVNSSVEDQDAILLDILKLCDWKNRAHLEDRLEALASVLGFREPAVEECDIEKEMNFDTDDISETEKAVALRDVIYFFLGQQPCSVIIEHGHFADALSWSDLHYLMGRSISVGLLVTARVGSNKDDYCRETKAFESNLGRRRSLKDFQVSLRSHSQSSNSSPNTSGKDNILHCSGITDESSLRSESSRRKKDESLRRAATKMNSRRSYDQHFFDLEEPQKEDKIAYDRAHYTESYDKLISYHRTEKLELPMLEVDEIGHLFTVDLHWHEEDIKPGLLQKMHNITHGNSYWCKEVAHYISVRGQDDFMKEPIQALGTVVVTKVNEKLTMEQQITVKAASVIGYVFSMENLMLALPQRVHESVTDSMMYLADHNFLTKLSEEPLVYSFPNSNIRDILHDLSPPSERSNLHTRIAQRIEGINEHNLEPFYEV
jgi:class 3 adenylate cyclase